MRQNALSRVGPDVRMNTKIRPASADTIVLVHGV